MRLRNSLLAGSLVPLLGLAAVACAGSGDGRVTVVASFYPLAWAAERVGGDLVDVEDLTPPGMDAHDATLSAGQRADLQTADVVLLLGDIGFQPDAEKAAAEANGAVVEVSKDLELLPSTVQDLAYDPHLWLDPALMQEVVGSVADALVEADPANERRYRRSERASVALLQDLDAAYSEGLASCGFSTFVTSHEAFGYLAARYGLSQLGIEGLMPESEPTAARIETAIRAIDDGRAAPAVFYEATDEGRRVGEAVASDAGVPSFPLGTLEAEPASGDYVSVMRANLAALQEGLRCS